MENKKQDLEIVKQKRKRYLEEEIHLFRGVMSFNSMAVMSPYAKSTAIVSGDLMFRSFPYLDESRIAELYMLNSKSTRHQLNDLIGVNLYKSPLALASQIKNEERLLDEARVIELPKPREIKERVDRVIQHRRSIRKWADIPVPLEYLATLLYHGNGITGELRITGMASEFFAPLRAQLRAAPSGGALYPITLYVIAQNMKDLNPGLYYYNPPRHCLVTVKDGLNVEELRRCFSVSEDTLNVREAAFIIVMVANLWKTLRKYGNRGLRYIFIEAGEIGENIHLAATGLRLGTVDVAGYYDPDMEEFLGIDGITEHVVITILGGVPKE